MVTERTVSGSVPLAVRDHGGRGTAVLCVHGLASNALIFDRSAAELGGAHRVVAYDQRGHGLSGDPADGDYSFGAVAEDASRVVAALSLGPHVAVGHSWGASVALHHAARDQSCIGVVCVDGGVSDMRARGMTWAETERRLRPPELEGPPDELLARMRAMQPLLPWDGWEPVLRRSFVVGDDGVMRRRTPISDHMRIVRELWATSTDVYEAIPCPVLLVMATGVEADPTGNPFLAAKRSAVERLVARVPSVAVEWMASIHDVPLLHPAELASTVGAFVGRVTGKDRPAP